MQRAGRDHKTVILHPLVLGVMLILILLVLLMVVSALITTWCRVAHKVKSRASGSQASKSSSRIRDTSMSIFELTK
jgi:hypothetical protein